MVVHAGVPATLRIQENVLVASDGHGHELWRRAFSQSLASADRGGEEAWIGDLGDGRQSVVFAEYPANAGVPTVLHCFDEEGRERWRFVPGRTVRTADGTVFAQPYRFHRFVVGRLGHAQQVGIVVTSYHFLSYPNQVVLLSGDGRVLREYWHSGHLSQIALANLNGTTKIYLGGVSNARKRATLVVLDPDHFGGASAEPSGFQLQGLGRGREDARVFFPATCMTRAVEGYNVVAHLWQRPGTLTADVHERVTLEFAGAQAAIAYDLSPGLAVQDVALSDTFVSQHAVFYQNHQLDHPWTSAEKAALRNITVVRSANP
jgi:hypothetical protein